MSLDQVKSALRKHGGAALTVLERFCVETSSLEDGCISEAIGQLVHLRDQLIIARRAGARCSDELDRTNAILSSVFGLEFPISNVQRTRIREAHDGLKEMLRLQRGGGDSPV